MTFRKKLAEAYDNPEYLEVEERFRKKKIKDIPILILDDNSICCIPHEDEVSAICCAGMSGMGKCLEENTEIFADFTNKKIKDVKRGDLVVTLNKDLKTEFKPIIKKEKVITKENLKIKLKSGEEIICSKEHKFLIIDNNLRVYEKKAEDINIENEFLIKADSVPLKEGNIKYLEGFEFDWDFGFLIGIYLAEGSISKVDLNEEVAIHISSINWTIKKFVESFCMKHGIKILMRDRYIAVKNLELTQFIKRNFSKYSKNKRIPKWAYKTNKDFIKGIISGYFNGDGCINVSDCGFTTKSKKLSEGIRSLLMILGINCNVKEIYKNYLGRKRKYYEGIILDVMSFKKEILLLIKSKVDYLNNKNGSSYYMIPFLDLKIKKEIFIKGANQMNKKNNGHYKSKSIFYKYLKKSTLTESVEQRAKIINLLKDKKNRNPVEIANEIKEKLNSTSSVLSWLNREGIVNRKEIKVTNKKYSVLPVYRIKDKRLINKDFSGTNIGKIIRIMGNGDWFRKCEVENLTGVCRGTVNWCFKNYDFFERSIQEREIKNYSRSFYYSLNKKCWEDSKYKESLDKSLIRIRMNKLKDSDIFASEIDSIKKVCKRINMYHIEVEDNHNFMLSNTIISCNSLLAHHLVENIHGLWKDKLAIMFDVSEETYKWSEPMDCKEFNEESKLYLNQEPCPLPMVYIYPNTNTLELSEKILKGKNFVRITLPFDEIVDDIGFYLSGINPEFELKGSAMYINNLKEDLANCESQSEIKEVLESELPGGEGKSFKAMRIKIFNAFDSLFNEQILDKTSPEYPAYLRVNNLVSNPISIIMKTNHIPALITSDLTTKKYKSALMAHYVNSIFRNKERDFPNERVWLFFDELWELCKMEGEPASKAVGSIATRGRIKDVGLIYSTQFYDKIPNSVKGAKLNYLFCFQTSSDRANMIANDFDLNKHMKDRIRTLRKFECMAMTRNKFRFYRGDDVWEDSKPVVGRIFFPLSNHLH